MTDLDKIRESLELFSNVFPLAPEIWLKWLRIEVSVADTESQLQKVDQLFKRALADYFSADVAMEYANLAKRCPKKMADEIWEVLIPTYGLDCMKGRKLFAAYREYILSKEGESSDTLMKLMKMYEKELQIPLYDMEDTYIEFKVLYEKNKEALKDLNVEKIERRYKNTKEVLQEMLPFEKELSELDPKFHQERAAVYKRYISRLKSYLNDEVEDWCSELKVLHERMVTDCCLNGTLWLDYVTFIEEYPPSDDDNTIKAYVLRQTELDVVDRALRNCERYSKLYVAKIRILERMGKSIEEVKLVIETVMSMFFHTPEPVVEVWLAYLAFYKRNIDMNDEKQRDKLRANFKICWDTLGRAHRDTADPNCEILQFWGRLEYGPLNDMLSGRDLWTNVINSTDNSTKAGLWIEFANLELKRNVESARKIYKMALKSPFLNDIPTVVMAFKGFERLHGTANSIERCEEFCEGILTEYYRQFQEAQVVPSERKPKKEKGVKRKQEIVESPSKTQKIEEGVKKVKLEEKKPHPHLSEIDTSRDHLRIFISNLAQETTEQEIIDAFPELLIKAVDLKTKENGRSLGFGYAELATPELVDKALSFDRRLVNNRPAFITRVVRDKAQREPKFKYAEEKEPNKLYVSGLPFETTKEELQDVFSVCGKIKDIRIPSGKKKGIAYVEYENEKFANEAVKKYDKFEMKGFTINVAISNPPPKPAKGPMTKQTAGPSLGGGKRHEGGV